MDEDLIDSIYKDLGGQESIGVDFNTFQSEMFSSKELRNSVYSDLKLNSQGIKFDRFESEILKKKGSSKPQEIPQEFLPAQSQEPMPSSKKSSDLKSPSLTEVIRGYMPENIREEVKFEDRIINQKTLEAQEEIGKLDDQINKPNKYDKFTGMPLSQERVSINVDKLKKKRQDIIDALPKSTIQNNQEIKDLFKPSSFRVVEDQTPGNLILVDQDIQKAKEQEAWYRSMLDQQAYKTLTPEEQKEVDLSKKMNELSVKLAEGDLSVRNEFLQTKKEYDDVYANRYSEIDNEINSLKGYINNIKGSKSPQEAKDYIIEKTQKKIDNLETQKLPFFKQLEQKEQEVSAIALEEGKTPQEMLKELLQGKTHELTKLKLDISEKEDKSFLGAVNTILTMFDVQEDPKIKRYNELENEVKLLSKITFLNKTPEIPNEGMLSVAGKTIIAASDLTEGIFPTDQTIARTIDQSVNELGLSSAVTDKVKENIEDKSKEYGLNDRRFYGQTMGQTATMLPSLFLGGGIVNGAKYLYRLGNIAKGTRAITAATSAASSTRVSEGLNMVRNAATASRAANTISLIKDPRYLTLFKAGAERSAVYSIAGGFSRTNENELTALSGAFSGVLGKQFSIMFNKAVSKSAIKSTATLVGNALGEVVEENAEDFGNAVNRLAEHEDFNKFMNDLDDNFGSWDVNMKRTVAAIFMSVGVTATGKAAASLFPAQEARARIESLTDSQREDLNAFLENLSVAIDVQNVFDMDLDEINKQVIGPLEVATQEDIANIDSQIAALEEENLSKPQEEQVNNLTEIEELKKEKIANVREVQKNIDNLTKFVNLRDQTSKDHSIEDRIAEIDIIEGISKRKALISVFKDNPVETSKLKLEITDLTRNLEAIYAKYNTTSAQATVSPETVQAQVTEPASESTNNVTPGEKVDFESKTETDVYTSNGLSANEYIKSEGFQDIRSIVESQGLQLETLSFPQEDNIAFTREVHDKNKNKKGLLTTFTNGNSRLEIGSNIAYFDSKGNQLDSSIQLENASSEVVTPEESTTEVMINESEVGTPSVSVASGTTSIGVPVPSQTTTPTATSSATEEDVEIKQVERFILDDGTLINTTTPGDFSNEEKKKINQWNEAVFSTDKSQSQRSAGFIKKVMGLAKSANSAEKMSIKIFNEYGPDFSEKLVGLKELDINLRQNLAKQLSFKYAKEGNETKKDKYDEISAVLGRIGSQDTAVSNAKTLIGQIKEMESSFINQANHVLGRKTENGTLRDEFNLAAATIIEELKKAGVDVSDINNIQDIIDKIKSGENQTKAEKRAKSIKKEKEKAIAKLKKSFGSLSSSGLTKEGIEAVSELAYVYAKEGINSFALLVEKIKADIKNALNGYEITDAELESALKRFYPNYDIWSKEKQLAVEKLSKLLSDNQGDGTKLQSEMTDIERFADNLIKNLTKGFKGSISKKNINDTISDFLANVEKYQDVLNSVRDETFGEEVPPMEIKDIFDLKFFNDKIKKELNAYNLSEIIKTHFSNLNNISRGLYDTIVGDINVSPDVAEIIANQINSQVKEKAAKIAEQKVNQMIRQSGTPVLKKKRMEEKLIEMFNMGHFSNQKFLDFFHDIYGIDYLSEEDKNAMQQLILISETTNDPALKAVYVNKFNDYLKSLDKYSSKTMKMLSTLETVMYGNFLSGENTLIKAIVSGVISGKEKVAMMAMINPRAAIDLWSNKEIKLLNNVGIRKLARDVLFNGYTLSDPDSVKSEKKNYITGLLDKNVIDLVRDVVDKKGIEKTSAAAKLAGNVVFAQALVRLPRLLQLQNLYMGNTVSEKAFYHALHNKAQTETYVDDNGNVQPLKKNKKKMIEWIAENMRTNDDWVKRAEEQYEAEMETYRDLGLDISEIDNKSYKKLRIRAIQIEHRDQNLMFLAKQAAGESMFSGDVKGLFMGNLNELLSGITNFTENKVKPGDTENTRVMNKLKGAAALLTKSVFTFIRFGSNFTQWTWEYTPVGAIKYLFKKTYTAGKLYNPDGSLVLDNNGQEMVGGFMMKTPQRRREQLLRSAIGSVIVGLLIGWMFDFEWDDEGELLIKIDPDCPFRITAGGYSNSIGLSKYGKNIKSLPPSYMQYSIQWKDENGDWSSSNSISYLDLPLSNGFAFMGELFEELYLEEFNRQVNTPRKAPESAYAMIGSAVTGMTTFSSNRSYNKGQKDAMNMLQNAFTGGFTSKKFMKSITKFAAEKARTFTPSPAAYTQINALKEWYNGKTMDIVDENFLDIYMKNNILFSDYFSGKRYDILGHEVKRSYISPIPPAFIVKDIADNFDYKNSLEDHKFLYKFGRLTLPDTKLNEITIVNSKGYNEDITLTNKNWEMYQKFFGDEFGARIRGEVYDDNDYKYIRNNLDEIEGPVQFAAEVNKQYEKTKKNADRKMREYIKKNKEEFDKEQGK